MNDSDKKQILKLTEQVGKLNGTVDQMDKNISKNFSALEKRVVDMHNSVKSNVKSINNKVNTNRDSISQMKGKTAGIALAVSLIVSLLVFFRNLIK